LLPLNATRSPHAKHLLGWLTVSAVRHQFGIAQDGVERGAQLMAHIGEELRLVLARLFELSALVLDFVKQPHILDRNRGLVGKCRDQFYLLVGEWLYFRPRQTQDADWNAFAQHWDAEDRAVISQSLCFDQSVLWISLYIGNMHHATFS
jgi:hypothetical protein